MKKIYIFLSISWALFISTAAFAQPIVNIPDANFHTALINDFSINTNFDANIDSAEAASYAGTVNVQGLSIVDMTGIQAFTSISGLNFSSNPGISSVTLPVSPYLTNLDCYNCNLGSLDVSADTSLTDLNCAGNVLTSLDVSSNTHLVNLFCQVNSISSLDVSSNALLQYLDCSSNLISTVNVNSNTALTNLYCNNLGLTSLNVSNNPNLSLLDCSSNNLTTINVANNYSLINLNCAFNSLTSLNLVNNYALMQLQCQNNNLGVLDLIPNWQLTDLNCGNNPFTCLDLHNNTWLTNFTCFNATNLLKLNLRNGTNTGLTPTVFGSPSLGCVQVDDSTYSASTWSNFGGISYFSNDCGQPSETFTNNAPVCHGVPVQFTQTTANIDWFKWDFGDGDTTTVMVDPAHLYNYGGSYFVTLSAGNCYGIAQPNASFDLGNPIGGYIDYSGGAFGDGNVILLQYDPVYTTFDTVAMYYGFEVAGWYSFGNVFDGQYIVKVHPDTSVLPNVIPTYSGNQANWETALVINHSCIAGDNLDITMLEITPGTPGSGNLSGEIIEGAGFGRAQGDPIHGVDVKLGITSSNIIGATITDSLGQYTFANVPDGTYTIFVDIPGLYKDSTYTLTIGPGSYDWTYLDYQVDSNSIDIIGNLGVHNENPSVPSTFTVYPNPVKDNAMIKYSVLNNADISFEIYNSFGVKLNTIYNAYNSNGDYLINFNPTALGLKSGVYFVSKVANGKRETQRIIILE